MITPIYRPKFIIIKWDKDTANAIILQIKIYLVAFTIADDIV